MTVSLIIKTRKYHGDNTLNYRTQFAQWTIGQKLFIVYSIQHMGLARREISPKESKRDQIVTNGWGTTEAKWEDEAGTKESCEGRNTCETTKTKDYLMGHMAT